MTLKKENTCYKFENAEYVGINVSYNSGLYDNYHMHHLTKIDMNYIEIISINSIYIQR